ncbi:MAG: hypothetical protein ABR611_06525 [Chthoniobacterales bacterium]
MKTKLHLITACTVAVACCLPFAASAASKKSASLTPSPIASASPKTKASPTPKATSSPAANTTTDAKKARAIPFHGKISGVDQKAKTFTLASKAHPRLFKITDKTTMTKAGKPATMKDVVANEDVRGSYWKVMDGTLEAKTVKLGPKTDAEKAADEKAKARKKERESATETNVMPSATASPSP